MIKDITALVIDDHPLLAKATKELLEQTGLIRVLGVAGSGGEGLELACTYKPTVIFLDYLLPDMPGTEISKRIKQESPETHVIIFTGVDYMEFYNTLIDSGVSGVLSKEAGERTIVNMVHCVLDGHTMVPLPVFQHLQLHKQGQEQSQLDHEEAWIMRMLIGGATYDQIADAIHMSRRTVDNYMKRIFEKMGVKTRIEAIEAFLVDKKYSEDRIG